MVYENKFQLTRKEFADKLGISTDNLKKKMKLKINIIFKKLFLKINSLKGSKIL